MFAATRVGEFELNGAACEPEILDVLEFLKKQGVDYQLDRRFRVLRIHRNEVATKMAIHRVIPDRVEVVAWLVFSCLFRAPLTLTSVRALDLAALPKGLLSALRVDLSLNRDALTIAGQCYTAPGFLQFALGPFPLLATDYGPLLILLGSTSVGSVTVRDTVAPYRYRFLDDLRRHGISAHYGDDSATLFPVHAELVRFSAQSTDLRGAIALLLFGLRFSRNMKFYSLAQVLRGWHDCESKLSRFGISFMQEGEYAIVTGL